jgi:hypothetical protein
MIPLAATFTGVSPFVRWFRQPDRGRPRVPDLPDCQAAALRRLRTDRDLP